MGTIVDMWLKYGLIDKEQFRDSDVFSSLRTRSFLLSVSNLTLGHLECRDVSTRIVFWQECKLVQVLWKTLWRSVLKGSTHTPYEPVIPVVGIYPT